jgi:putative intracellular protease/amidase
LRVKEKAVSLMKAFYDQKKIVAAVCHAPGGSLRPASLKANA